MSQGRSQQTDALNDFDAALAIDHFTDHGRVIETVRTEDGEHFIDRFGRVFRVVAEESKANHAGNSVWANGGRVYLSLNHAFLGVSFETGNVWEHRGDASFGSLRHDASVFLGMDTFLGPVYVASGFDDRGQHAFYLFLGRTF